MSSSRPRCFKIDQQRRDRLVGRVHTSAAIAWRCCVWLSQLLIGPPAPLQTCTNRTPRSTSRRASRQRRPKSAVRRLIEPVQRMRLADSWLKSNAAGALNCILAASS